MFWLGDLCIRVTIETNRLSSWSSGGHGWKPLELLPTPHVDFGTFANYYDLSSEPSFIHKSFWDSHLTVHMTVVFSLCSNSRSAISLLSTALDCAISPSNTGDKTASSGTVGLESVSLGALLLSTCK